MSWIDNLSIIQTAVYGKEMRPAIVEALMQNNGALTALTGSVNELKSRVDALPDPGDGDSGDDGGGTPTGSYVVDRAIRGIDGGVTPFVSAGEPTVI